MEDNCNSGKETLVIDLQASQRLSRQTLFFHKETEWGVRFGMRGWYDQAVGQGMSFLEVSWFLGGFLREELYTGQGW